MFRATLTWFLLALVIGPTTPAAADRPNFIFFLADDISWDDIGCYGHPTIKTPHIDRLAAAGLRFTNAYLTTSSCSPSRCSIITGRYPHNTGAPELHTSLPAGQVLFPELLKVAGYHTVLSGKHHMGNNANPAFSKISKGKGPGKEGDWVQLLKDRPKDKPFFCWYASTDAPRNWSINDEAPTYDPKDVIVPPYLVDGLKTREDLTGYYHEVSRFDHFVGEVVEELKRQGVLDNTVIIVMADNGRPFPRCKTRLYDSGIKTPFIAHFPNVVKPSVTESLVSAIDIAPTVLELAGVKRDKRLQGVSFAPLLDDPKAVTRDVVFAEHNWHVYRNHERLVRTGDWLYIRNNFP
ncbi:MAG: sulfatase, partial [Pseudomonadales bacterium]